MISNCGSDERGKYRNGKPGDQTGKEWKLCQWYSRPWDKVFRFPYANVANLIGEYAIQAADNNNIGYSQSDRYSFYRVLSESDWNIKMISIPCNADCSSGVMAVLKAVGMQLDVLELCQIRTDMTTRTASAALKKAGFKLLTGKEYTSSDVNLAKGDILLATGKHMAINVTNHSTIMANDSHIIVVPAQHRDVAKYKGTVHILKDTQLYANSALAVVDTLSEDSLVRCYGYYNIWDGEVYLYVTAKGKTGYIRLKDLSD